MADLSPATGLQLLYDDGVLPPNPARQALAFASVAQNNKLSSDGLASKKTATVLAMEEEKPSATVEFSSETLQFLVDDLASPESGIKSKASAASSGGSGYPHAGWAGVSSPILSAEPAVSPASATPAINLLA